MELKRGSSKWLKGQSGQLDQFHWQGGYGAFSIGQSVVTEVASYNARQEEHHRRRSFQDEFTAFLKRYETHYDEDYLWT